ncbi:1500_t:CDS:2, partial [Racocetra persica]
MERVPTLKQDLENIVSKNPGHIIATTACLGGELSKNVLAMENARKIGDNKTAEECKNKIINFVLWCKNIFGEDFYFEVAPAANRDQIIVNKKIAELSKVFNVKMVIGCDAHYLIKEDRYVHKSYLNSKGGEREIDAFYEYSYLQTEAEIIENLTPSIVDLYEEMCENNRALDIGLGGIAITDHECLSCHVEVNKYAQELAKEHPDFKVALGNEIYLIDDRENCDEFYHFILIAKDKEGHRQLRELSSLAWMNSYFFKGMERVPTLKQDLENI